MPGRHEFASGSFRNEILSRINERNKRESRGFSELFQHHERLFENWAAVKEENLRLQLGRGDSRRASSISGGGGYSEDREKQLEHKVLSLQEELTELHRKRGENASQVLSLSAKLTDREAEISQLQSQLAQNVAKCADLEEQMKKLQAKAQELEATNNLLKDEHQALQLAYSALEDQHIQVRKENAELVQRYIEIKKQHADLMNQENENFVKTRQAKVQKELEDAAKEMKQVVEEDEKLVLGPDGLTPCSVPQVDPVMDSCCLVPTRVAYVFDSHEGELYAVRWSPNGKQFATGGADRKVKLWEKTLNGAELKASLTGANASILSVDFDVAGNILIAASSDYAIRLWTVEDHRLRHTLTGHSQKVLAARFLGDASKVASGSHDRTLKIWDLRSRACVSTKFAGSSCNDLVCVDGSSVISGHYDKRIRFWDVRTESTTQEIALTGRITSLDLSMDKNFLLASVRDDSLQILDLRMNALISTYSADGFKISSDFDRSCFSPNGMYIACGTSDGSIFIWSVMENKVDSVLKEHCSPVVAVHWHPRGSGLISMEKTKKTIIWTP